jgi:hypothetical protein
MRKFHAVVALAFLSLTPFALAQAPAAPSAAPAQASAAEAPAIPVDQQATREQVEKLFQVLRMHQQFKQIMSMMSESTERAMGQGIREAIAQVPDAQQLTPEQQEQLRGIMEKYMNKATTLYTADELIADATPVYQHHMTRSDIDAYIAFYSSAPGQRFLDAQPVIMKEYMPIVMAKAQERSKTLDTEMMQDIVNFVKTQKPQPAPAPAKQNPAK